MTTPGSVSEQSSVPARASVGRWRDAGAKSEAKTDAATAPPAEDEGGFGAVLSKMQKGEEQQAGEAAAARTTQNTGKELGVGRHAAEIQAAVEESLGDAGSATAADDAAAADLAELLQTDASGSPAATAAAKDLAAIIAFNPPAAAAAASAEPAAQPGEARQAGDPAALVVAALDEKGSRTEVAAGRSPSAAIDAKPLPGATDPAVAALGVQGSAPDNAGPDQAQSRAAFLPVDPSVEQAADGAAAGARQPDAPATQRVKASVLRQETHFAPVAASSTGSQSGNLGGDASQRGVGPEVLGREATTGVDATQFVDGMTSTATPTQQIADRVLAETAQGPASAERPAAAPDQQVMKTPLKVLHIQLQPADLGTVTVRMELKDDGLTVHVEADSTATADMIRSDQDTLSKLLRSAGYNVDSGSIRVSEGDRTLAPSSQSGQAGTQTNLHSSPQSHSGQSHSGASDRQGQPHRGGGGAQSNEAGPQSTRNDSNETTANRGGVGLYL